MGYPYGLPSVDNGNGTWTGTTPADMQRILGQQYMNAGVLPGPRSFGAVAGTTGWSYMVPDLAVLVYTSYAERNAVIVPIQTMSLPVSAPVGGAARTDVIYVGTDGVVRVTEGATGAPAGTVTLGRMNIPAGATNTQGAVDSYDRIFAVPAGASLGRLATYTFPSGTWSGAEGVDVVRATRRIVVPTDRLIRIELSLGVQSTSSANGWSAVGVEIDGTIRNAMHMSYDGRLETNSAVWTEELTAGAHTVEVFTVYFAGTAFKTPADASSCAMHIWDAGVAS